MLLRREKLDLLNPYHREIAINIYNKHQKWFKDDSIEDVNSLINHLHYLLSTGDIGYVFYVNNKPYGIIIATFDRYNNALIEASTLNNQNFFLSRKILKYFIEYLFDVLKINKVKVQIFPWNKNAELLCRALTFRKEGILKDEILINQKPISLLYLSLTKANYLSQKLKVDKQDLRKLIRKVKND